MTQENIVLDPTFNVGKEAFNPSGAVTIVPRTDPSVPPNTPVPRVAKWIVPGSTTANTYIGWGVIPELRNPGSVVQMSIAAGEVYEFSADVFMEASGGTRQHGFWMQMYDATGTSVGHTWVPGSVSNKSGAWETLSGKITIAPTAVTGRVTFRASIGEATNLWICNQRWTKQTVAQAANASAQSALDARVTQTETGLTTQAGQIVALNTGVAGKADNSALQSLMSTVTQQGSTLTSQGTAVTQLQSTVGAIGGSGTNLLPDTYSWLSKATLPATFVSTLSRVGVEVAGAASGFGFKLTLGSVVTSQFLMLSPSNNASGFNIDMEPGGYLVSMYVQGSVDGTMRVSMYNGSHRWSSTVAYTTTRQRLVFVCTATAFARSSITIYPNMAGLPAGTDVTIDSVMIEKQIGISTEPSPFVAGSSAMTSVGQATAISSLDTRVTETEGVITAQASKLDGIYVQVNPVLAGEATGFAGSTGSLVGVWSEQSARIEDGVAQGLRTDAVQAQVDTTSATVQETSSALASLDGKVSATWSVKLQVNSQGQYVAAGVGLGIENTPAGLQSQFLVSADRFAVVNGINGVLSSPFVVNQGQVFIKDAFIANGSITMLKIGDTLQSDNFVAGIQGWRLTKSGQFEINGHVPGQGTMVMTNRSLRVYDSNNVKRVQLGDLSE
ncbi:DUF1983 domain-containing protein [Pseudomonas sp. BC115LW]|nr:DUF1983 domain-containing protein [Pseudomonas sp. BC115LW]NBB33091.1 DUF1983 domain-containing protein [Pseudomonas sp. BC115LW]